MFRGIQGSIRSEDGSAAIVLLLLPGKSGKTVSTKVEIVTVSREI